jgi:hypothetical protein
MLEIGKTFMYNGIEYRVNFINNEAGRFGLEQIGEKVNHEINQKIKIDDELYKVVYVHSSKNRISIKPTKE